MKRATVAWFASGLAALGLAAAAPGPGAADQAPAPSVLCLRVSSGLFLRNPYHNVRWLLADGRVVAWELDLRTLRSREEAPGVARRMSISAGTAPEEVARILAGATPTGVVVPEPTRLRIAALAAASRGGTVIERDGGRDFGHVGLYCIVPGDGGRLEDVTIAFVGAGLGENTRQAARELRPLLQPILGEVDMPGGAFPLDR